MPPTELILSTDEREALKHLARSRRDRMDLVTRARGILMLAGGATYTVRPRVSQERRLCQQGT
jgi:hypothetical protein